MPNYSFNCPDCGHFSNICIIANRNKATGCPKCKKLCDRDVAHELQTCSAFDETTKEHVRWSNAMGCNPKQIPEMMKKYPGSSYSPDGKLEIIGRKDKLKKLKERGLVEFE